MPVVELLLVDRPVPFVSVGKDGVADRVYPLAKRRYIVPPFLGCIEFGLGHCGDHLVGHEVYQAHKEMAGAHCRVADLQIEKRGRRIEALELADLAMIGQVPLRQLCNLVSEGAFALFDKWFQGLGQDELDKIVDCPIPCARKCWAER